MPPQSQNCRTLWRQRRDLLNAGCRLGDMTIGHIVPTKQAFAEFLERAAKDRCPRNGAVARDLQTRPITNSKYLTLGKAAPMRSLEIPGRREAEPNRHFIEQKLGQALTRRRHAFRIEKPMQMHNKVAHFGVVDGSLRLCPPGRISAGVIGIDTDEIKLFEILELYAGHVAEFAAEYKVKELVRLLRGIWHDTVPWSPLDLDLVGAIRISP